LPVLFIYFSSPTASPTPHIYTLSLHDALPISLSYFWQQVNRRTDGSLVNVGRVLRVKLEYQLSRPLFVRVVGQYIQDKTDSLREDRKSTRLNSSHRTISYAVFCLKKKKKQTKK